MMNSENLKNMTMIRITVIISSSGLSINGCQCWWNEDSKTYILGTKILKYGAWINFYPKTRTHTETKGVYLEPPQRKTPDCDPERPSGSL